MSEPTELDLLRLLADKAVDLLRGCDCDYDYRCGRCETVIRVRELAEQAKAVRK